MELLVKNGWTSARTIEVLILEIAASLVSGEARVEFGLTQPYTLGRAKAALKILNQLPDHQRKLTNFNFRIIFIKFTISGWSSRFDQG